jgi:uncharacterized protein YggE
MLRSSCLHAIAITLTCSVFAAQALAVDRTIAVSGSGVVRVAPDQVEIAIALEAVDDDLVRVRASSDQQVKTILELAQKHGVQPDGFDVSSLKLGLSYNEQLKRQIYHVDRSMSLKLGVLANLNALLAELLKQPDAKIGEIRFGASKARDHELEARTKAVADAKETAGNLAQLAGLKLGKAIRIESYGEQQRPFVTSVIPVVGQVDPFAAPRRGRDNPATVDRASPQRGPAGVTLVAATLAGFQAAQPPAGGDGAFGLGQIEFSATVSIEFEMTE